MHRLYFQKVLQWGGFKEHTPSHVENIYFCPMHPQVRRNKPGLCPICNMQLVEMKEEDKGAGDVLTFTDRQIQQGGVRFATVRVSNLLHEIDTTGRVVVDERLLRTISSWIPGVSRIERLHVNFTGDTVRKGGPLVTLYSPELITTQEEYLLVTGRDGEWASSIARTVELRLKRWGIDESQIEEIRRRGRPIEYFTIHSPLSGTVIERMVTEGEYVKEGDALLRLCDLSRVWIYGDIYEYEIPYIRVGMEVEVSGDALSGMVLKGRIDFIDPVVQEETRTVRVRFTVDNRGGFLKPGMYVRVRIRVPVEGVVSVPESAVLFTGRRALVILYEGGGRMKPVEVRLGKKWLYRGDKMGGTSIRDGERYHEVVEGLREGQKVVIAGNFLIASEARLQGVIEKMLPPQGMVETEGLSSELTVIFLRILDSYERIRRSLARDETTPVRDTAGVLSGYIKEAIALSDGDVRERLKEMEVFSSSLSGSQGDIVEIRRVFSSLSRVVLSFAERYGLPEGAGFHAFICPMVDGYGGWLQRGRRVENPYMGQMMSECGNPLFLGERSQ